MTVLDSIAQHPYAALGAAAWSLWVLYILQEAVALIATGQRPPAPPRADWGALTRSREDSLRWLADLQRLADDRDVQTPLPKHEETEADEDRPEEVPHDGFECSRAGRVN